MAMAVKTPVAPPRATSVGMEKRVSGAHEHAAASQRRSERWTVMPTAFSVMAELSAGTVPLYSASGPSVRNVRPIVSTSPGYGLPPV